MFAQVLHIRPFEIDLLTVEQFDRAVAICDQVLRQQEAPDG